jgi:Flp pilus assembly protein TadG
MRRDQRGAALVEAAIALPLLLLLLFGIVTTARAWNVRNTLDHAAREAARAGAVGGDMLGTAQGQLAAAGLTAPPVAICTRVLVGASNGNCLDAVADPIVVKRVQVLVTYPGYRLDFLFFSVTVNMSAPAVARTEPGV